MGKDAKFVVRLSVSERLSLEKLISQARAAKAKLLRARMLLKADADGPAWSDPAIAEAFDVSLSTVHRLRERFVWEGFDAALDRKPFCRTKPRVLDGAKEARLIATVCSAPPEGQARWTMRLLADKLVELKIVESISGETVRKTLQKTSSSPGSASNGSSRRTPTPSSSVRGKKSSTSINAPSIRAGRWSRSTKR